MTICYSTAGFIPTNYEILFQIQNTELVLFYRNICHKQRLVLQPCEEVGRVLQYCVYSYHTGVTGR